MLVVLSDSLRTVILHKKGVGTYCPIPHSGLRITFDTDKTTAHTKGYVISQQGLYKSMMWCHCYHLRVIIKVAKFECRR